MEAIPTVRQLELPRVLVQALLRQKSGNGLQKRKNSEKKTQLYLSKESFVAVLHVSLFGPKTGLEPVIVELRLMVSLSTL